MGENTNPGACLAFLNADWYDFESTPAAQEDPGRSITLFDPTPYAPDRAGLNRSHDLV
jgi:hypothetical protein